MVASVSLPISILLVDDHPMILNGVAAMLAAAGASVTTAKNLADARERLAEARWDMLLLDINMAQDNGLTLLEAGGPPLPPRVVLFSGISEQEWIFRGFALGATGFVSKSLEPDELLAALAQMHRAPPSQDSGWIWCPTRQALVDAADFFPKETQLTPKEREVFMLLKDGLLDKQIADQLGLSIHTVRVHIRAIKRKRGHNRRFEQHAE